MDDTSAPLPKGKINESILNPSASNAWRHYRFSNLTAGSGSFQNNHFSYLKQEHNRKRFLPLQEMCGCTYTFYTVSGQCFAAHSSTAGAGASRSTVKREMERERDRERENQGFSFNKASQQELETCMTHFSRTFTPRVDKRRRMCFRSSSLPWCPSKTQSLPLLIHFNSATATYTEIRAAQHAE